MSVALPRSAAAPCGWQRLLAVGLGEQLLPHDGPVRVLEGRPEQGLPVLIPHQERELIAIRGPGRRYERLAVTPLLRIAFQPAREDGAFLHSGVSSPQEHESLTLGRPVRVDM